MSEEILPLKKKFETIALSDESSQKITQLIEQASQKKKGIKISSKNFANWLIEKFPDNLGTVDMASLIEKFYDEETFLKHLLREIKKNKLDGKTTSDFEIVLKSKKGLSKKELVQEDNATFDENESEQKEN